MKQELAGKRVAITGASRGLGRAMAIACAREGADVVLFYREAVELLKAAGCTVSAFGSRATSRA